MRWSIRSTLVATCIAALLCVLPIRHLLLTLFVVAAVVLWIALVLFRKNRNLWTALLMLSAMIATYTLSIGPVSAAHFWFSNYGDSPSKSLDRIIDGLYLPVVEVSDMVGLSWYRSYYLLQWYGYVWPADLND